MALRRTVLVANPFRTIPHNKAHLISTLQGGKRNENGESFLLRNFRHSARNDRGVTATRAGGQAKGKCPPATGLYLCRRSGDGTSVPHALSCPGESPHRSGQLRI